MPITAQFPAIVSLSILNGQTGFKLTGENVNDYSGVVSSAGDVNGDGVTDIIIGAWGNNNNAGASYLVFGHAGVWTTPFSLGSLNGNNGVKFTGENTGDQSGRSVSAAGDINGDGIADLLIGAYGYNSFAGASYLVFGHNGTWTSPISLSSLTGVTGVKFTGVNANDYSFEVSAAGDINADGIDDFIIGADGASSGTGFSYLIFGHNGAWTSPISLSNITGATGVKFTGENTGDYSGAFFSSGSDVNGDGINDLMIGSPHANAVAGASYLVFGHNGTWISPISLSSITGATGVKFTGVNPDDGSGTPNSLTGDVNGDGINDLAIGAYGVSSNTGACYLVFGHTGNWNSPIALSSLTGSTGVEFTGENVGDYAGIVSSAGDVNGDGLIDLIIGAPHFNNSTGTNYLVFGHTGIWNSPIALSSLMTGTSGVKFNGENFGDVNGFSVQSAGDVNADGLADFIIGAYGANSNTGASYVVFGDNPSLIRNQLVISEGSFLILNNTYLCALTGDKKPLQTQFNVSNIQHGYFELLNQPGQAITNFTQAMINNNQIRFVHDGSCSAPSYKVSAYDGGLALPSAPQSAAVSFSSIIPSITRNYLILNSGLAVVLSPNNLNATDPGDIFPNLRYTVSSLIHGQFSTINDPFTPINQFTQQQINDGDVQFVSDTSGITPSYTVSVQDSCDLTSTSSISNVNFYALPSVRTNRLTINEGQTVLLTSSNLNSTSPNEVGAPGLTLTVSNVQHGHFELINQPKQMVTHFTQQQINDLQVRFIQDGSCGSPTYQVSVFDGGPAAPSAPTSATVTFYSINPAITKNTLFAIPGQGVILGATNLNATDPGDTFSNLLYTVSSLQHGQFSTVSKPTIPISQFTQQQVNDGFIQFMSDNSGIAPSYALFLQDSCGLVSSTSTANISFHQLPILDNNRLTINQDQSLILTSDNFKAEDRNDKNKSQSLQFLVSNVQHGHFEAIYNPGTVINSFYQQNVSARLIEFIHDGSVQAPSFSTSVSDGLVTTLPSVAGIDFNLNSPPDNTVRNAIIGSCVSGGVGLIFAGFKYYLNRKADELLSKTADEYEKRVILPIAKELSKDINFTKCGYISADTSRDLLDAMLALDRALVSLGLPFEDIMNTDSNLRVQLKSTIVRQTRNIVIGESSCSKTMAGLICPEVTPQEINKRARDIASAVKEALEGRGLIERAAEHERKERRDEVHPNNELRKPLLKDQKEASDQKQVRNVVVPMFLASAASPTSASAGANQRGRVSPPPVL